MKAPRPPKDPDAPPPPDLDAEVIQEIQEHLEACGGSTCLGKLTSKFHGLKKVQLEGHFELQHGEKDSVVRLLNFEEMQQGEAAVENEEGPAKKKRKKDRERKDPNAPVPALEYDKLQKITDWLGEMGGSAPLGRLTTVFSGVKKAQVEEHFVLTTQEGNQDPIVSTS